MSQGRAAVIGPASQRGAAPVGVAIVVGGSVVVTLACLLLVFRLPLGAAEFGLVLTANGPRVLFGAAVGGLLGLSGAVSYLLVPRPLAEVQAIGLSAGLAAGGLALSSFGPAGLGGGAFLGAAAGVGAARLLDRQGRLWNFALAFFLLGMLVLLLRLPFRAEGSPYRDFLFWAMGDLSRAGTASAFALAGVAGVATALVLRWAQDPTEPKTAWLKALAALAWGIAAGAAGPLAFVPLFAFLLARAATRTDQLSSLVVPAAAVGGAMVVLVDATPRFLIGGYAPPWNSVAALFAIPAFLWWNRRRLRALQGGRGPLFLEALEALVILALGLVLIAGFLIAVRFLRAFF